MLVLKDFMKYYKKLFLGFGYAFKGILYTVSHERNMRVHIVCMAYMYYYLFRYDFFTFTRTQLAVLILANGLVIAAELFNTAIERTVDAAVFERNAVAGHAKDAAAGGVFVCALFSVAVGCAILWQPEAFKLLREHYVNDPVYIFLFVLSVVVFSVFIFIFDYINERKHYE